MILVSKLRERSLRLSAREAGVKVLLYEGGEALRFDEAAIDAAVKGCLRVMAAIGMIADGAQACGPCRARAVDVEFLGAGARERNPSYQPRSGDRVGLKGSDRRGRRPARDPVGAHRLGKRRHHHRADQPAHRASRRCVVFTSRGPSPPQQGQVQTGRGDPLYDEDEII